MRSIGTRTPVMGLIAMVESVGGGRRVWVMGCPGSWSCLESERRREVVGQSLHRQSAKAHDPRPKVRASCATFGKLRSPKADTHQASVKGTNLTRAPIHHFRRLPQSRAGPQPRSIFFPFSRAHPRSSHDAAQPRLPRFTSPITALRQRRVHARPHSLPQRRQCRCYSRHEASVR
jgi:hypothetical protein